VVFGARFDELFGAAIGEIKSFAKAVEELGGSILSNIDGVDVTVEHVQALEEGELLKIDYVEALDKFRRVSKLKKEIDKRPRIRRATAPAAIPGRSGGAAAAAKQARTRPANAPVKHVALPVTAQQLSMEEAKLRRVEESIRIFVRVADPKFRQVVPMRFFNLNLTVAEVEAYCADYLEEKSLRAEVGRTLLRSVAVIGRIQTEIEELKRCQPATSLWKLRADALVVLLDVARSVYDAGARVVTDAQEDGQPAAADAVQTSARKLRERAEFVVKTLAGA
jgi:hypothetical protein